MIVISNNLIGKMAIPEEAVIRINLAWINDYEAAQALISSINNKIYLDYPDGRKKPPRGKISLTEAIKLASNKNVAYFAVSNCEDVWKLKGIINELPKTVEFVPKIETEVGINNMTDMVDIGIKTFMLDKEDLYTDVKGDADKYNKLVERAREYNGVIELQGVVFI